MRHTLLCPEYIKSFKKLTEVKTQNILSFEKIDENSNQTIFYGVMDSKKVYEARKKSNKMHQM